MFSLKCTVCDLENPENNKFCSSCGKPLLKPQSVTNNIRAGTKQAPVPATHKGSGLGLVLLGGGALFLIAVVVVGIFVILPMFEEETPSWEDSGISSSYVLTDPEDSDQTVDSPVSLVSGSGEKAGSFQVTTTTTLSVSPPVQGSSSTSPADLIIGTWEIGTTAIKMQFDAGGVATLRDTSSGYQSTGSWERVSDGRYRLWSASGAESPILISDPLAGILYFEDYSTVFIRKG